MSIYKKLFGYFLILFSLLLIVAIGLPQLYLSESVGRIDKEAVLKLDFLKDEDSPVVLVYFGYVGCETICTPSLQEIAEIYKSAESKDVKMYFINLINLDDKDMPNRFAKHFHKEFIGLYLEPKELYDVVSTMNISYTKSLSDKNDLNHSGHLYLLKKENSSYTRKVIYVTRPFDKEMVIRDIQSLIQ